MSLQQKYQQLIKYAQSAGITNLQVREQNNVLYIDGQATSENARKQIWDIYNKIDPDYRSGDLILNVTVPEAAGNEYVVVKGDTLSSIGKRFGVGWKEIFEANPDQIKNPDLIQPGWKLKIPGKV